MVLKITPVIKYLGGCFERETGKPSFENNVKTEDFKMWLIQKGLATVPKSNARTLTQLR